MKKNLKLIRRKTRRNMKKNIIFNLNSNFVREKSKFAEICCFSSTLDFFIWILISISPDGINLIYGFCEKKFLENPFHKILLGRIPVNSFLRITRPRINFTEKDTFPFYENGTGADRAFQF